MKKILGLLLLLVSFASYGQFTNYTNINGRYKWIAGKFDSTFTLPSGTTPSLRVGGGTGPGALFYSTTDSSVYQYTGSQWTRLRGTDTAHVISAYVRNTTGSILTPGQVVYINGSTGTTPTVALAVNTADSTSAMTFGFVRGNIAVNGFGYITTFGPLEGVNTNAYTEGEVIYLDSIPGQFTHDKPQAPYHMVTLGYIIKKSGGNGTIYAKIQNGYELEELHNVRITAPVLNKSVIIYDSVNDLWVDTTVSAAGLGLGGSGTTNYLSKWTSSSALGNSLVFDDGTNVGIGTTSPTSFAGFRTISVNNTSGSILDLMRNGTSQFQIQTTSSINALAGQTNLPMSFQTNGSERMRIFGSTGNISIGYGGSPTDGGFRLDISGTFRSTLDANINGLTVGKGGGSVAGSTAVGFSAISANSTGAGNSAFGYQSLQNITSGSMNVALGYRVLTTSTTGISNIGIGGNSSGDGSSPLFSATTGSYNVGIGAGSLKAVTTSSGNTAVGYGSGLSVTGEYNALFGYSPSENLSTGNKNIVIGFLGARTLTTGSNNIVIGNSTDGFVGNGITTGNYNTIIGSQITGLSASLSNTIILADGQGNQRLVSFNDGNVYIGGSTSFPTNSGYKLDVNGTSRLNGTVNIGTANIQLANTDGSNVLSVTAPGGIKISSDRWRSITSSSSYINNGYSTKAFVATTTLNANVNSFDFSNSGNYAPSLAGYNQKLINGAMNILSTNTGNFFGFDIRTTDNSASLANNVYAIYADATLGTNTSANRWAGYFVGRGYFSDVLAIGTTTPESSALLDITSTTKGFLPPRMTGAEAEAIATPAAGLMVYANNGNGTTITSIGWWGYDGTNWVKLN